MIVLFGEVRGLRNEVLISGHPIIGAAAALHEREAVAESALSWVDRLARVGAKFVYVFDPDAREGRTWDNGGAVEDVATGSAAGPAAAYLAAHGLAASDQRWMVLM